MFRFLYKSIPSSKNPSQLFKLYSTKSTKPTISTSNLLNFDHPAQPAQPDQPDPVLSLFKKQGFSDTQIKKLVTTEPKLLSCNHQNTLLPNIQFFKNKGFSVKNIATIIGFMPTAFRRSLDSSIVPSFNFFKDFLGSEKDAVFAISNSVRILVQLESHVKPAIEVLLGTGMSQSCIGRLLKNQPSVFVCGDEKLRECVEQLRDMEMDPKSGSYGMALFTLIVTRKSTWDKRMEVFEKWGCSEEDVVAGFKVYPVIMSISEEKVNAVMSFFVGEVGWEPSEVVKRYFVFTMSLRREIIPRWSVYQELVSKGLIKEADLTTMFRMKEDRFLKMFVKCHEKEATSLLKLYKKKLK